MTLAYELTEEWIKLLHGGTTRQLEAKSLELLRGLRELDRFSERSIYFTEGMLFWINIRLTPGAGLSESDESLYTTTKESLEPALKANKEFKQFTGEFLQAKSKNIAILKRRIGEEAPMLRQPKVKSSEEKELYRQYFTSYLNCHHVFPVKSASHPSAVGYELTPEQINTFALSAFGVPLHVRFPMYLYKLDGVEWEQIYGSRVST